MQYRRVALAGSSSLACLIMITATPVAARDTASTVADADATSEAASLPATDDTSGLQDIIVTAQRRSESLQRTPISVAVITSDTLTQRAITSETDLQVTVPGLTVRTGTNSNSLNYSLRGQSIDNFSFSPPAVLPYLNEVAAPTASSSAFYDLQSIQVLKGPQGTLFGRNATGGAVLFTTAKPTDKFEGYITGRLGNYDQRYLEAAVNLPLVEDKVLLRVAGALQHRDGFQRDIFDGQVYGTIERQSIRGSLTIQPSDGIKNEFVIDYQHSGGTSTTATIDNVYPIGFNNAPIASNFLYSPALDAVFGAGAFARYIAANPRADPGGIGAFADKQRLRGPYNVAIDNFPAHDADNLVITNITTFDIGDDTQFKNVFGYGRGSTNDRSDNDGTPFAITSNRYDTDTRFISNEPQLVGKTLNGDLSYIVGVYFASQRQKIASFNQILNVLPVLTGPLAVNIFETKTRSLAGFVQGTYNLSNLTKLEGLSVTAGFRYTSEKIESFQLPGSQYFDYNLLFPTASNKISNTFKKPSWTIGIQEQLNPNLLLYVVTRRSFRSGGFNGSAPPFPGNADVGGAGFKSEIATDVEIGAKFQGRIANAPTRLALALYNMQVKDNQRTIFVVIPQNGAFAAVDGNIPESRIKGFEADAQISLASWLTIGGSLAYTDAKFSKGDSLILGIANKFGPYPDTPEWSGSAFAEASTSLPNQIGTLSLRGDVYAQSKFFYSSLGNTTIPNTDIPAYTLVNLRLGLDNIRDTGFSVSGSVKNLFNKTYYTGGLPTGSVQTLNSVVPGDRRTIFAEVKFKW